MKKGIAALRPALFALFLLLPVLFQTLLGFQSGARWAWEGAYLALALGFAMCLWRREDRGGWWCVLLIPVAAVGWCFCQNPWLGAALGALAAALLVRGRLPMAAKLSAAALVALACLCSAFALLILPLRGTARYVVCGPSGSPLEYAEVEVVDPGAMGRIRYYAVEQTALADAWPLFRVGVVTGRDSAPSGTGKYGFLIDRYFELQEEKQT